MRDWVTTIPWAAIAHPSIPGTPYQFPPGFHLTAIDFMWLTLPVLPVCPTAAWGNLCLCVHLCTLPLLGFTTHSLLIPIDFVSTHSWGAVKNPFCLGFQCPISVFFC